MRCFEEAVSEPNLSEPIALLAFKNAHLVMQDESGPGILCVELVMLRWPFDDLRFCRTHEHGQKDVDFEIRSPVPHWSDIQVARTLGPCSVASLPASCQ